MRKYRICIKTKYRKGIFIPTFIVWFSTEILFNTTLKSILGVEIQRCNDFFAWLVFVLLFFQIFFINKYKKEEIIPIILVSIVFIIATVRADNRVVLSAWMFVVAARDISLKKVIKFAYYILIIMIMLVILLFMSGIIEDKTMIRYPEYTIRHSLGFSHPNQLGLRVFQLVLCHLYLRKNIINLVDILFIVSAAIFCKVVPNSQTAYGSLIILVVLVLIYQIIKNNNNLYIKVYTVCMLSIAICSNILSVVFGILDLRKIPILLDIDLFLSSRFSVTHDVYKIYGITLWGQKVYVTDTERQLVGITKKLFLDNAYMSLLIRFGIASLLIFSVAYYFQMKREIIKGDYMLVIIFCLYSIYGVMETGLYSLTHNIFLIALSDVIYCVKTKMVNREM